MKSQSAVVVARVAWLRRLAECLSLVVISSAIFGAVILVLFAVGVQSIPTGLVLSTALVNIASLVSVYLLDSQIARITTRNTQCTRVLSQNDKNPPAK